MTISLQHAFESAKSDGADATRIQPSHWNAEHVATMASDRLLGRDTASTGVVEELTVGGGLEFSGSGGIQRSAISGDVTIAAASGTAAITAASIVVGDLASSLYVEGSWTPALAIGAATGITYTTQVGRYIKIGSHVTIWGKIILSSNGSGNGLLSISGLPFTSSNVSGLVYGATEACSDSWSFDADTIRVLLPANSSTIQLCYYDGSQMDSNDGLIDNDFMLTFSFTYRTG